MIGFAAKIIGIKFEIRNGEVLSYKMGTAVIAANHQSFFDVLGMYLITTLLTKSIVKIHWRYTL